MRREALLRTAETLLNQRYGTKVRLTLQQRLKSRHRVLRCAVDGGHETPSHVILKRMSVDSDNRVDDEPASVHLFRNELANLRFLHAVEQRETRRGHPRRFAPRVIAHDAAHGLLVLEDLGTVPTLQDVLFDKDAGRALGGMQTFAAHLASLHVATRTHEAEFNVYRDALDVETPVNGANRDIRAHLDDLGACLDALHVKPATGFFHQVRAVEAAIYDDAAFRVFSHNDAGPHNTLRRENGVVMLDYEFAGYASALVDAVGLRMSYPSAYWGRPTPPEIVRHMEAIYRDTLRTGVPAANSDRLYYRALSQASAHWALSGLVGIWWSYLKERLENGPLYDSRDGRMPGTMHYTRQRIYTHLKAFTATAYEFDQLEAVRETVQDVVNALYRQWPTLDSLTYFPTFFKKTDTVEFKPIKLDVPAATRYL